MSSRNIPVTTAASSSNVIASTLAATTSSNIPAPAQAAHQPSAAQAAPQSSSSTVPQASASDLRLILALGQLNRILLNLHRQDQAAGTSNTRRAQINSWLDANRDQIDGRLLDLAHFVGSAVQPSQNARLRQLLVPYDVPSELLAPEQPDVAEASESKRKHSDSPPQPSKKGKGPAKDTADKGKGQPESGRKQPKYLPDCPAVVRDENRGRYVELRCNSCKTNTIKDGSSFLRGMIGFQRHYSSAHGEDLSMAQVFSRLSNRSFTDDEASQINQPGGIVVAMRRASSGAEGEAGPSGTKTSEQAAQGGETAEADEEDEEGEAAEGSEAEEGGDDDDDE